MKHRANFSPVAFFIWLASAIVAAVVVLTYPDSIQNNSISVKLSDSIVPPIIAMSMLGCIVFFAIINVIVTRSFIRKYNSPENIADLVMESNERLDKARENYLAAESKVFKSIILITLYKVLITLWFVAIFVVALVGTQPENPLRIASYVLCGISGALYAVPLLDIVGKRDTVRYNYRRLKKVEYPLLFETVERAKRTLNCDKQFVIYAIASDGISVSSSNEWFNIFINIEEFAILTRDELYQIMLHEIAHVINNDTERNLQLERFSAKSATPAGKLTYTLFLGKSLFNFEWKKIIYYQASSKFHEQDADRAIKDYGNAQSYINATAKTMLLGMYNYGYKPEINFYIFSDENPPSDYYERNLALFEKYLEKYGERWNYILTHRIESRADTHPTFAKRMSLAGVDGYDYTIRETDAAYQKEQKKLLQWGCNVMKNAKESYTDERNNYYLPNLERLEQFKKLRDDHENFSSTDKVGYLDLLYTVDRDECLTVCNEVLADFPRSAYANYFKGIILAERLDSDCVDCLYTAAEENYNFAEQSYMTVAEFACNTGDAQLLEKYRARFPDDLRSTLNRQYDAKLQKDDQLRPNSLPEEDSKAVLDFILSKGGDIVENIYSVSRGQGKQMRTFYYIEETKSANPQDVGKLFNDLFYFLDQYGEGDGNVYDFALYGKGDDKRLIRLIKNVKGSLLYSKPRA